MANQIWHVILHSGNPYIVESYIGTFASEGSAKLGMGLLNDFLHGNNLYLGEIDRTKFVPGNERKYGLPIIDGAGAYAFVRGPFTALY